MPGLYGALKDKLYHTPQKNSVEYLYGVFKSKLTYKSKPNISSSSAETLSPSTATK